MARIARVVAVGVAHHVTQRGVGRRFLLASEADRQVYLDLLRENLAVHKVMLVGYCLMSNHVHLIVIPEDAEGLALSMKHTHGRYATYSNVAHNSSGHAWQGRYFSCPLNETHLWEALRYTELNPVRAHLVTEAHAWAWSSAAAHCGTVPADESLSMALWLKRWTHANWCEYLAAGETGVWGFGTDGIITISMKRGYSVCPLISRGFGDRRNNHHIYEEGLLRLSP